MKTIEQKRIQAILFFAWKSPGQKINRLKLMKLLWLADRIHLNRYGRMILRDNYSALPHGPVPSKTKDYTDTGIDDILRVLDDGFTLEAEDRVDTRYFSKSDLRIMEEVWDSFGIMDQFKLEEISHLFPEWLRYKEALDDEDKPNSFGMLLQDFFKQPTAEVDDYKHDEERSKVAKEVFNTCSTIQDFLTP